MLISTAFSLLSTFTAFAFLSAPFCLLQLALCKFCPWKFLQLAPLSLYGVGLLWGWRVIEQSGGWDVLLGILIIFPCIFGLIGSGAGWFLWKKR